MSADVNYKSNFVSYVFADRDVIIFIYEVPFIFWHYIDVGEVSWITLKTLIQSAIESFTNCDSLFITKCYTVYCKLRQVLHSAMNLLQIATVITKCDEFITNCDRYYKVR